MSIDRSRQDQRLVTRASVYLPVMVVASWVFLYFPTFEQLLQRWTRWDENLSYGLPVMALFVYLLIKSLPWHFRWPSERQFRSSILVLASLSALWFLTKLVVISTLEQLLLLPILVMALGSLFGVSAIRAHRFLLLLPIFAIPIWTSLNGVLLDLSSLVVGALVRAAQIPAQIDGNSILIPHGHILIADGCSGLRYFVISVLLGYLVAYLNGYNELRVLPILIIAAVIGLLANWIRIFALILIGYQTKMQSPLMTDHEWFGWGVFALMVLPSLYFAPVVRTEKPRVVKTRTESLMPVKRLLIVIGVLALGPVASALVDVRVNYEGYEPVFPTVESHEALPVPVTAPEAALTETGRLSSDVVVRLDHYQRQSPHQKLVPYFGHLYPTQVWLKEELVISQAIVNQSKVGISVFRRRLGSRRIAQLQWFELGEFRSSSLIIAKLMQIPAILNGHSRFTIVTLQTPCTRKNCKQAVEKLADAARSMGPSRHSLRSAQDSGAI